MSFFIDFLLGKDPSMIVCNLDIANKSRLVAIWPSNLWLDKDSDEW